MAGALRAGLQGAIHVAAGRGVQVGLNKHCLVDTTLYPKGLCLHVLHGTLGTCLVSLLGAAFRRGRP